MLFTSGEVVQKEIPELFSKCWEEEWMPEKWFHTLVSYMWLSRVKYGALGEKKNSR